MLDPASILQGVGTLAGVLIIGAIVFAESGLLLGFFLPGDTLLFTAGFFAAQGKLPLAGVLLAIFLGSVLGDNVGFTIGKKTGPRMFRKKDGLVFRQEYILRAEKFYEKHGGKTVIFARFVPVVRTFAPMVAGIGKMPRKTFVLYSLVGAATWTGVVTMLGYWLGSLVDPHTMEKYIIAAIIGALLITVGPTLYHLLREERLRAFVSAQFKRVFKRYEKAASTPDKE
jgi:membrane-associated protein